MLDISRTDRTLDGDFNDSAGDRRAFERADDRRRALAHSREILDGYIDLGYGTSVPIDSISGCDAPADLFIGAIGTETITEILLPGNLVDTGPRDFAQGEVGYDDQGRIATYTVAAGDVEGVIGARLCIYNGGLIGSLNGHKGYEPIQPGEVLVINPEAVPGFEYEDPYG